MRLRTRVRRALIAGTVVLLCGALTAPGVSSAGQSSREIARQKAGIDAAVDQSSHELEHASAQVRAAAGALARVQRMLPGAQRELANARGALAAARAKDAAAAARLKAAEAAVAASERKAATAGREVVEGRKKLGERARAVYQRGPLADIDAMLDAESPTDLERRRTMLNSVLETNTEIMRELADARARLASERAELRAQRVAVQQARKRAAAALAKTQEAERRAIAARVEVGKLIEQRAAAHRTAESERAVEAREYRQLQRTSEWLGSKLRAAAAEERRRAAAAARAAAAKRQRNRSSSVDVDPPRSAGGQFLWPVNGHLTSRYGYRYHPIYKVRRFHAGIDIGSGYGNSIWAAEEGTVVYAGYASGYGQLVLVTHGIRNGRAVATAYGHMSSINVVEGEHVSRGEKIAEVGSLGASTGPHLHFEVRLDGDPVDPMPWL